MSAVLKMMLEYGEGRGLLYTAMEGVAVVGFVACLRIGLGVGC